MFHKRTICTLMTRKNNLDVKFIHRVPEMVEACPRDGILLSKIHENFRKNRKRRNLKE